MPSPSVAGAPAQWVLARNWARASEARLGAASVEVGGQPLGGRDSGSFGIAEGAAWSGRRDRSGTPRWLRLRTVAADLRRAWRNLRDTRRPLDCELPRAPDFVWEYHSPFFRRGRRIASSSGCPVVRFVDAPQVWEARRWGVERGRWGELLERIGEVPALRDADLVCCVSDQVRRAVIEIAGLPAQRVVVTPNTTSASAMTASRSAALRMRARWGVGEGTMVLGWTGSFRRFHDLGFLLDAVERIDVGDLPWTVVLVGEGRMRAEIEEDVRARRLPVRCVGSLPHAEIAAALGAMDLAVVPLRAADRFHYAPLKLREYSAAGLPIVAPEIDDTRRLLGADAALFYPPGDVDGLAGAVARLLVDPVLRDELTQAVAWRHARSGETGLEVDLVLAALQRLRGHVP